MMSSQSVTGFAPTRVSLDLLVRLLRRLLERLPTRQSPFGLANNDTDHLVFFWMVVLLLLPGGEAERGTEDEEG